MKNDFLELMAIIGISLVVFFGPLIAVIVTVDYLDCQGFSSATGRETKWRMGCYVKVADQWVPKQYVFGNAHEFRIKHDH